MFENTMGDPIRPASLEVTALPVTKSIVDEIDTPELAEACKAQDTRNLGYRAFKRAFDIVFSLIVIAVALVPCMLLAIVIAVDTKGFPIYSQERVGRLGKSLPFYKFRTMVADADDVEKYLNQEQLEEWRLEHKVTNDPRITRLGSVLRKTSLDEIPQFVNVLLGQISVIGPRAITREELPNFGSDVYKLLSVPQGITGAWQVGPRNEATFQNGQRQLAELGYAEHASLKVDVEIFLATFGVMFKNKTGR